MTRGPDRPRSGKPNTRSAGGRGSRGSREPGGARTELQRKVDDLVRDTHIPRPWAWQVARGQAKLNDVITRLAQADRVAALVSRHGLDKSIATQVASGVLDLDAVLRKKRMSEHLAQFRDHATLGRALADGQPRTLHLHGLRTLTGRVVAVDRYELQVEGPDGTETLHKIEVKLVHAPDARVRVRGSANGRAVAEPVPKPQDRYACSDRRLFAAHDDGTDSRITTLEGDELVGQVAWIARWELGLRQKGGAEVVVFRHAIKSFEEA